MALDGFNPRPRAGGDVVVSVTFAGISSFNPRPRAGGDGDFGGWRYSSEVSIHAPARGATAGQVVFIVI